MNKKKRGLSRRQFLGTVAGTALTVGAGPNADVVSGQAPRAAGSAGQAPPDQTLVLTNGRIHTMNAANTVANTVSIRNGRFVAVGGRAPAAGPNTRVIDLKGRTAVPGIIEAHIHSVSLANRPGYHTILENTTSIREIQEALAARRKDVPAGAVDHVDGRLASEPVGRASPSDAAGARRSGAGSTGAALRAVHRPVRDEQPRQGVLRRRRCGRRRCIRISPR